MVYYMASCVAGLFGLASLFWGLLKGWWRASQLGIALMAVATVPLLLIPAFGGPGLGGVLAFLEPSPAGAFG